MIKIQYFLLFILILLVIGCNKENKIEKVQSSTKDANNQEISLTTEDNLKLKATFYQKESDQAIILLHILNSNRHSYNEFALLLNKNYGVLSIDSRGHGESELNWNDFSENDFNDMVLDIKAARNFLSEQGFRTIHLVGASIGANTVLNYAVTDNSIKKIVLLSPGLNYRGVLTEESIKQYKNNLLTVASKEDIYSFSSSEKLFEYSIGEKEFLKLNSAGHGTNMFSKTNLMNNIIEWLEK